MPLAPALQFPANFPGSARLMTVTVFVHSMCQRSKRLGHYSGSAHTSLVTWLGGGILIAVGTAWLNGYLLPDFGQEYRFAVTGQNKWQGQWTSTISVPGSPSSPRTHEVRLQVEVVQDGVAGVIASPALCERFPSVDYLRWRGIVRGRKLQGEAYAQDDENQPAVTFVVESDAERLQMSAASEQAPNFPVSTVLVRDHGEPGATGRVGLNGYCNQQREEFIRRLRAKP